MDIEGSEFKVITDEFLDYIYPIVDNLFVEVHTYPQYCSHFDQCRSMMKNKFINHGYKTEDKSNDGLFVYK